MLALIDFRCLSISLLVQEADDEEWNLHKHRIWLLSYLFSLSNSSSFSLLPLPFFSSFGLLNCCQFSAAAFSMWNHSETEAAAVCLCPLIHLPVYYCHMSQLANLQHMQQQQQQQRATHGACCCNSSVRSPRSQHLQNFCHDSQLCHTHTHTDITWPSFSFRFCIFHFNCQFSVEFSAFSEFSLPYSLESGTTWLTILQRHDVQEASELLEPLTMPCWLCCLSSRLCRTEQTVVMLWLCFGIVFFLPSFQSLCMKWKKVLLTIFKLITALSLLGRSYQRSFWKPRLVFSYK